MSFIYRLLQMVVSVTLAAAIPPLTHCPPLSYIAHTIGRSAVMWVYISRLNFSLLLPTIFSQAAFLVVFLISNTLYSAVYLGGCGFIAWGAIITKTLCIDYYTASLVLRGGAFNLHPLPCISGYISNCPLNFQYQVGVTLGGCLQYLCKVGFQA